MRCQPAVNESVPAEKSRRTRDGRSTLKQHWAILAHQFNSYCEEGIQMKSPVVVIGIGEMGGVFARGFLRAGYPVFPATRQSDLAEVARAIPTPELVLVAVAENDLHGVLEQLPPAWFQRIGLLQNELLPGDWEQYGFAQPTVISVWFEKKKGQDVKVLIPSPAFGKQAGLLQEALGSIDIPVRVLDSATELLFELVIKNV